MNYKMLNAGFKIGSLRGNRHTRLSYGLKTKLPTPNYDLPTKKFRTKVTFLILKYIVQYLTVLISSIVKYRYFSTLLQVIVYLHRTYHIGR